MLVILSYFKISNIFFIVLDNGLNVFYIIQFRKTRSQEQSDGRKALHPAWWWWWAGRGSASLHIWPESAPGQEMRQWAVGGGGAGAGAGLQ